MSHILLYNFADGNALSFFGKSILELIDILQFESKILLDCFKNNKMIVNPNKFQTILLDKIQSDHTNQRIIVDNQQASRCIICRTTRNSD